MKYGVPQCLYSYSTSTVQGTSTPLLVRVHATRGAGTSVPPCSVSICIMRCWKKRAGRDGTGEEGKTTKDEERRENEEGMKDAQQGTGPPTNIVIYTWSGLRKREYNRDC